MNKTGKKPNTGFTQVPNDLIANPELSGKAKALFMYLLSKPEGWDFNHKRIAYEFKEGEKWVRTGLQELEEFGFLEREKKHDGKVIYHFHFDNSQVPKKSTGQNGNQTKWQPGKIGTVSNTENLSNTEGLSNTEERGEPEKSASPSPPKHKTLRYLEDLPDIEEIASEYEVPQQYISDTAEKALTWLYSNGRRKKDYRMFLKNWIMRDKQNSSDIIAKYFEKDKPNVLRL
jgi:hypothetical protein